MKFNNDGKEGKDKKTKRLYSQGIPMSPGAWEKALSRSPGRLCAKVRSRRPQVHRPSPQWPGVLNFYSQTPASSTCLEGPETSATPSCYSVSASLAFILFPIQPQNSFPPEDFAQAVSPCLWMVRSSPSLSSLVKRHLCRVASQDCSICKHHHLYLIPFPYLLFLQKSYQFLTLIHLFLCICLPHKMNTP